MKHASSNSLSLFLKLALGVGTILFISMGFFSLFSIGYVKKNIMTNVIDEVDRFSNTIKLGTHYSMMNNVWEDITQIIDNVAKQRNVQHIRIFHKEGHIVFSNTKEELGKVSDISDYACTICHKSEQPPHTLALPARTRFFSSPKGEHLLGIVNPIYNETGCSSASCHAHSPETTILGILDVVISLDYVDREIAYLEKIYSGLAILSFIVTSCLIFLYLNRFVSRPVKKMITGTEMIARGERFNADTLKRNDEMGLLASAISSMGIEIANQQDELKKTNDELILVNKQLEKLSTTDPLTGLANRRSLIDSFTAEYERAKRYNHRLSILLIDVDFFKKVNDTYGHNCGDKVLRKTSDVLRKTVRSTDLVSRYGGEEFIVLLPETDNEQAHAIAEKLRHEIATHTILCDDSPLSITISIGIATHPDTDSNEPMQLINAADQALYKAKSNGRNQVVS
ncbi:MAG: diguanylate cyclase [Desulfobulbaceae bacterium]|nr:diguanylate cyclase [Desulfobulbaceae bacterium]